MIIKKIILIFLLFSSLPLLAKGKKKVPGIQDVKVGSFDHRNASFQFSLKGLFRSVQHAREASEHQSLGNYVSLMPEEKVDSRVTFKMEDASLKKVLDEICGQTKIKYKREKYATLLGENIKEEKNNEKLKDLNKVEIEFIEFDATSLSRFFKALQQECKKHFIIEYIKQNKESRIPKKKK